MPAIIGGATAGQNDASRKYPFTLRRGKAITIFSSEGNKEEMAITMTSEDALGGRIPLLEPDKLNHAQDKLYKTMQRDMAPWAKKSGFQAETGDHRMIGPFNPMLLSPEISAASLELLTAEREHTTLSDRVREIVILTTGAAFQSAYEIYAHKAVAKSVGLEPDVIEALASGAAAAKLPKDEMAAYELTRAYDIASSR